MILLDLLQNFALLVTLAVVGQVIEAWWRPRRLTSQLLHGLLFGVVGVVSMMTPVHFMPGIIFDGRSIILSVGGLFGGPIVALISVLVCGVYRLWLGGAGAAVGLGVILTSAALGVAFHYWRRLAARPLGLLELWGFGLLVHGVMLGLMLLLPGGAAQAVWHQLGFAIIGVYPVATVLICQLFLDYEKQRHDRTALEESEDKFKCFFEHSNVGQSITLLSGELQANQAFCDLLGYSPAELQHQSWQAITHPEDREPAQRVLDLLLSRKQDSARFTKRFLHKNGSVVWADVSTALRRDPAGQPLYFMTAVIDITERELVEAELERTAREWQTTFDATNDAIWILDKDHRVLRSNNTAEQFFHQPCCEMLGQPCWTIVHGTAEPHPQCPFVRARQSGHRETMELQQGERWFEVLVDPILDAAGQQAGAVHIVSDITERKRSELALLERETQLRLSLAAARMGTWDWDIRTGRTVWSSGHEALWGYAPGSFPGTYEAYESRLHPEDVAGAQRAGQKALDEHSNYEHEYRVCWPDGTVRWIASRGQAFYGPDDKPMRMIGVAMDITERKQAEADLRFVSRRLELIARMTNAVVGNRTTAEVAQRLAAQVQECFEVDACVIRILQDDQLALIGSQGVPSELVPARLRVHGLAQQILTTCKPLVVPDVRTHPLTQDLAQPAPGTLSFVSYAGIPLIAEGNTVGILAIYTTREPRLFTAVDVEHLQIVANHVAANLFNEHLFNTVQAQKSQLENVISEREKAEAEMRETAERLHLAQRAARFGIWDHDFKTQRSVWTVEQEALFGFAPGTYDGTAVPFDQLIHPDDRPRLARAMAQAVETGAYTLEFRATRRDGQLRWFAGQGQTYPDAAGRPVRMIGINIDITERKQAEERVLEQAALLDAANDAIYVRTLDHTLTYWNAGAERLYGWPRAEALGRKITEMGDAESVGFAGAHAALLEQGHWSGELTKTSKAGKELVVFCRWTLLRDEQGRPREVLAINTDITEKKQMEVQFLRAQRMEGIGALAGGIAHDLNNILAPILMVGPLLREAISDPESRQMLYTVENCAQRGADIIKQLLTFARGQPGVRAPLPVRHLLNEMHKLIRETFPRNIQSRVSVPKDLWPILGDATQIHQALMNLCVNARDALPEGGALTLAAENVTLDETAAALAPEAKPGAYVRVSVTDTGTGIPPEIVDRIFDPFFTTKEIGKGTGLGLATVLGIVRGHGGFVRVSSRVGQGTTFELHLPASPEAKAVGAPDPKALPPRGQGELILVVDDEASVREITQQTLEKYGYRTIAAREGIEALALFVEHREVRAVITDMMMPGMDGPKLVQALHQLDARLPIVGMTGLAERAGVNGLEALNLPVVLNKPFAGVNLLAAMSQVLASSRPTPQAEEPGPQ